MISEMSESQRSDIISFYDEESIGYSKKRYEGPAVTYTQFFFKNRLAIVLRELAILLANKRDLRLLDVGCADGVITRAIAQKFPGSFDELVGVDISEGMIETARKLTVDPKIAFFLKDGEAFQNKESAPSFHIALGLGYLSLAILDGELQFLKQHLKVGGIYICSLSAKNSSHARFKINTASYRNDYASYSEYEKILSKHFDIIKAVPNGLFIPKLWAFPIIGRMLQPLFDTVFAKITPNLFHENIYVLKLL